MDGREVMESYYVQSGMHRSGYGIAGAPPSFQPQSNPNLSNFPVNSMETSFSIEPVSNRQDTINTGPPSQVASVMPGKRKRGRPRKYGPEGVASLALSPTPSNHGPPLSLVPVTSAQKRGRGRPPGSGKKQLLASHGEWLCNSAGMGFTPHVISVSEGEDITTKVLAFSQKCPRAICILSANGVVSTVTLRQPTSFGGAITYEGRFEILWLSGSFLQVENGSSQGNTGGLCITLSSADGRVIGGSIGGAVIAASPVQVVMGTFTYSNKKTNNQRVDPFSGGEPDLPIRDSTQTTPTTYSMTNQNSNPTSLVGGDEWSTIFTHGYQKISEGH